MRRWSSPLAGAVLVALLAAGCGGGVDGTGSAERAPAPVPAASGGNGIQPAPSPSRAGTLTPDRSAGASGPLLTGWTVTVYYTAVERFHTDASRRVTGCTELDCAHGTADLGSYPRSFVDAVRDEGTGRTAAGRYLNWSEDTGYWLDDAPRDTAGRPLRPFGSAAADADVLRAGTTFTIVGCGTTEDGDPIPVSGAVCTRLRAATWTVTDEFSTGLGGARHVDVYIGEETGPNFTESAWYTTLVRASLRTGR